MRSGGLLRVPVNMFSSNVNNLAIVHRVVHRVPGRGIVCFKSATEIPCKDGSGRAIAHFSERVIHFLRDGRIGTVIITYGATDTCTLSSLRGRVSVPVVNIMGPNTGITTRTAHGKRINIVTARKAVDDGVCAACVHRLQPRMRMANGTYPLFIPLMRRKL